jgi:hypothetical protein
VAFTGRRLRLAGSLPIRANGNRLRVVRKLSTTLYRYVRKVKVAWLELVPIRLHLKRGTREPGSFWLVSALAAIGELQRARDLMERLLRIASPLELFAEEYDADTGRHLGNFPQAFSHLALIQAAGRIVLTEFREELSL